MHNYDEHYNMMNLTATCGEAANEKKKTIPLNLTACV